MPVATLKYNLPEEQDEFKDAMQGSDCKLVLWEIAQEIFRPARKHGYADKQIAELIASIDAAVEAQHPEGFNRMDLAWEERHINAEDLIGLLEKKFYALLNERGIEIG